MSSYKHKNTNVTFVKHSLLFYVCEHTHTHGLILVPRRKHVSTRCSSITFSFFSFRFCCSHSVYKLTLTNSRIHFALFLYSVLLSVSRPSTLFPWISLLHVILPIGIQNQCKTNNQLGGLEK